MNKKRVQSEGWGRSKKAPMLAQKVFGARGSQIPTKSLIKLQIELSMDIFETGLRAFWTCSDPLPSLQRIIIKAHPKFLRIVTAKIDFNWNFVILFGQIYPLDFNYKVLVWIRSDD